MSTCLDSWCSAAVFFGTDTYSIFGTSTPCKLEICTRPFYGISFASCMTAYLELKRGFGTWQGSQLEFSAMSRQFGSTPKTVDSYSRTLVSTCLLLREQSSLAALVWENLLLHRQSGSALLVI
eukprot:scaffold770_cov362-Pavlova_lutheri.AAC.14